MSSHSTYGGKTLDAKECETKLHTLTNVPRTYSHQSLVSAGKVAWRMLISWTGFECVWPCVGQKEPWDTETQQNWHWKQTEEKWGREEWREEAWQGGRDRERETNIWYHLEAALYAFTQKRNKKKEVGGSAEEGRGGRMDGWKDKRMDREAGFGEQES